MNKYQRNDLSRLGRKYNIFKMPANVKLPEVTMPEQIKTVLANNLELLPEMSETEAEYVKMLKKLAKTRVLPAKGHLEICKILLYVEQYYIEEDLKSRRLLKQQLTQDPRNKVFTVIVPNLDEDDPFINIGDMVLLDQNVLRIIEIHNGSLKARAEGSTSWYSKSKTYDVSFKLHNYSMKCCHFAIDQLSKWVAKESLLHPQLKSTNRRIEHDRQFFNLNILRNVEQKQAVDHIFCKTARPAPYILFGPPGTGKTATLVEAILQIHSSNPSNRVLICTPSNTAADEITRRLLHQIPLSDILRLYSPSRDVKLIDDSILPCANIINGNGIMIPSEVIVMKNIVVATLTTSMRLIGLDLGSSYFSYIFIDEAGQATEPETLIPFTLLIHDHHINTQVVLSGDPLQLGPVVKCKHVNHLLGMSMMERLMTLKLYGKKNNAHNPNYITKLVKNYRSHNAILKIPNELFYNNELLACGGPEIAMGENWEHLLNKNFPVIFHAVSGPEYKEEGSPSTCNLSEIDTILQYVQKLTIGEKKFEHKNIGVVTPFKLQERRIKDHLKINKIPDINVGTVQIFQGQEKDVIILSTVRSRLLKHNGETHIGFLSNQKRFNVSLTRAKSLLIVVGNPHVLKFDKTWNQFLAYCVANNACVGERFTLQESICDRRKFLRPPKFIPKSSVEIKEIENDDKAKKKSPMKSMKAKPLAVISNVCKSALNETRSTNQNANVNPARGSDFQNIFQLLEQIKTSFDNFRIE